MDAELAEQATGEGEVGDAIPVLVVDDETVFARAVCRRLEQAGFECHVAGTLSAARETLATVHPSLVLLDIRLPDGSGMDLLSELMSEFSPPPAVVVMTAFGEIEDAVSAMKQGASDYLKKPVDLDELVLMVEQALSRAELQRSLEYSRERESRTVEGVELIGDSAPMQEALSQIQRIAGLVSSAGPDVVPPTVLILGETGTGKDLAARLLHLKSPRRDRPFVHVDCGVLPNELIEAELFGHEKGAFTNATSARPGLIEAAEDGTVFLDEVGEVPLDVQASLLAFLGRRTVRRVGSTEERKVPAWVVAATNRDLGELVNQGQFRADLYYRLKELDVSLPPLRERPEDIPALTRYFVETTARRYGLPVPELTDEAWQALMDYDWPGNVRELRHLIERAVLLSEGKRIPAKALALAPAAAMAGESAGAETSQPSLSGLTLEEAERLMIRQALDDTAGNVSEAARRLGVTRTTLRYRMQKHGLSREQRESQNAGAESSAPGS